MMKELKFYNLDKKHFCSGEEELMKELNDAVAHAKAFTLTNGTIVVVGSTATYIDKRALDAIAMTTLSNKV